MKKEYLKPEISILPIKATVQLMAGSGPSAGDQGDPSMAPFFDDPQPSSPESILGITGF